VEAVASVEAEAGAAIAVRHDITNAAAPQPPILGELGVTIVVRHSATCEREPPGEHEGVFPSPRVNHDS
jgi:hypothetical protein